MHLYPIKDRKYERLTHVLAEFFDNKEFSLGRAGQGPYINRERLEIIGMKYIQLDWQRNDDPADVPVRTSTLQDLMEFYRERNK